jgi:hypothetical protein
MHGNGYRRQLRPPVNEGDTRALVPTMGYKTDIAAAIHKLDAARAKQRGTACAACS